MVIQRLLGNNMYVMTQDPERGGKACLPHSLSVANTYNEMTTGSRHITVVIRNQTTVLIIISKGIKIAQMVAANSIPSVEVMPGMLEKLDEIQGIQQTKMSIEQRKEMLLQQLELSGLEGWSRANCTSAHGLLTEYHDIFSLEPGELGCTGLVKHEIRVVDDDEMLEVGAICPSQSPRCEAIMLVRKKDGGLHFCIDFCKLNVRTKKSSYPLPHVQEAIESLVGAGHFSCLDLKADFWQITMDEALKQYTPFTVGNFGIFQV